MNIFDNFLYKVNNFSLLLLEMWYNYQIMHKLIDHIWHFSFDCTKGQYLVYSQ